MQPSPNSGPVRVPVTVADAIRQAAGGLAAVSDTARLDAEWLMAAALDVPRSSMLLTCMQDPAPQTFAAMVRRRMTGEPLAYVTGSQSFYGREFIVSPAVLIPRADSESVVEAALGLLPEDARILDCGTGSGALLLTLLAERPDAAGLGMDRSPDALAIARRNAEALGVAGRAELIEADWTQAGWKAGFGRFDLVIANPPYVESTATLDDSVRNYEPHEALFAGPDGLGDYRVLIPQLPSLLSPGGTAVVEIGWQQAESVGALARECGADTQTFRDLAHRPRGLVLRFGVGKGAAKG